MPTVTTDPQKILARVKELRKKAISYKMIEYAKKGAYNGAILIGYEDESESFLFNHPSGELRLIPFAFVQRANTPTLDPNAPAVFTDGILAGTDPGLDASVAVTAVLIEHIGDAFFFGESAEKNMSVFSNAKGVWKLIKGTDLVITKITPSAPTAPKAPKSRKK